MSILLRKLINGVSLGFAGVALVSLLGCSTAPAQSGASGGRPAWIDSPGNGVSAMADVHIRGRAAQEELAILRARTEYARQKEVHVVSEQMTSSTVAGNRASVRSDEVTTESLDQAVTSTMVKEKWVDPVTGRLWVWVVPKSK